MFTSQSKLLIRADAGPKVGTGHVMRMLALGQAWKRRGGCVTFVCGHLPRGLIKRIESEHFKVFEIQNDDCDGADAKDTSEILTLIEPEWVVVDGYRFDDAYQRTLCGLGAKLLVIDDYGHASHRHADLILNQNVYASANQYSDSCRAKVLAGPQFVLLRTEFETKNQNLPVSKKIPSEARRILVTFGGADPDNWTLKSLQVLSDLNRKRLIVDCVVGACYSHLAELEMFKKTANMSLRIHRNVDRMSQLMSRVDLAITAGGSTCYELARCGVPSIVTSIADNQLRIAQTMNDAGVMVSIDGDQKSDSTKKTNSTIVGLNDTRLGQVIRSLMNDSSRRTTMSESGARLVDGKGSDRIVRTMAAGTISFRPATEDDITSTWNWRNDPEVRSVALDKKRVPYSQHSSNFRDLLGDPQTRLWIAENSQGESVAQVCFDPTENKDTYRIRIIVDQARRGRGLGSLLIPRACEEFFKSKTAGAAVVAQIKPGNVACEKAFRAAGFTGMEPAIVNGKMAIQLCLPRPSATSSFGITSDRQLASRKSA